MPIELGDSWYSAKTIEVVRILGVYKVKHFLWTRPKGTICRKSNNV
jgi:hypothetical protein